MGVPRSIRLLLVPGLLVAAVWSPPAIATSAAHSRLGRDGSWQMSRAGDAYEEGYREGVRKGEQDGRRGRDFDVQRGPSFDRRDEFRRGFVDGYRTGYERFRSRGARQFGEGIGRRAPGGYQETAAARGYSDGFEAGVNDGRRGNRYDPVASRDYREADNGYTRSYGSSDAYRNNYRAGFRQGYEEGYRNGARRR
jgi:hypothetical protein